MKRVSKTALVLILALLVALFGCSNKRSDDGGGSSVMSENTTAATVQEKKTVHVDDPKQEDLEIMLRIFDSIRLAYWQNGISGEHSAKNADTVDIVLMYVINNYAELFDGITNDNGTIRITVEGMNTLAAMCFSDAKVFLETPASTKHFEYNGSEYVLKSSSDRGLQPYPVMRKTEKTDDGKIKTTVEFLTEDENYYYSTVVFYLVSNTNDKTGKYPWSVESFENVMNAAVLYEKMPFKDMSDAVKQSNGAKPYYQPIVMSYEDGGNGTVYVTAKMYRYDDSKGIDIFSVEIDHDYYSGDENDGLYKFMLEENDGKYIVKNSEKI